MTIFWKTAGGILLAVILGLAVGKREKDLGLILTATACIMTTTAVIHLMIPVLDLIRKLQSMGNISDEILSILLKCSGVGLITEIVDSVCKDAGSASMGKAVHMLGSAAIFWLSIPVLNMFLSVLQQILEKL